MKNFWTNKKSVDDMKGKCSVCGEYQWPMNDENILMQGDPGCACYNSCANLDIFYGSRFVQNEELQIIDKSNNNITVCQTTYTPVMPGSMSGSIEWIFNGFMYAGFTFAVGMAGELVNVKRMNAVEEDGITLNLYYDEIYACESKLGHDTGVLEIHHNVGAKPKVTVSYEYNKEE